MTWDAQISQWTGNSGGVFEAFLRLLLAGIAGGLIGLERELRGRQAGFRTYILVCQGSALVMLVSIQFALHQWHAQTPNLGVNVNVDPARLAYGVMTGIGFIGAGTILHNKGTIRGLTTAAGLWCAAAIGLAAGFGMYTITAIATLLVLAALSLLNYCEDFLPKLHYRIVTLRVPWHPGCVTEIMDRLKRAGMRVTDARFERVDDFTQADVHLEIGFKDKARYYRLAHELEEDDKIKLIATRETG